METKSLLTKALFATVVAAAPLGAAMLAGCSDSVEVETPSISQLFNAEGEAFFNISLNMPEETQTRANTATKGGLSNGDEAEYRVNSATLFLFSSTKEEPAPEELTFVKAYPIIQEGESFSWNSAVNGENPYGVTQSHVKVVKLERADLELLGQDARLFAYVIVNYNGSLTFMANGVHIADLGEADKDIIANKTTYDTFRSLKFRSCGGLGSFVMTNAPLYKPSANYVMELPEITQNRIYYSESAAQSAAESGEATLNVNVERMVAKVTVKLHDTTFKGESTETGVGTLENNQYVRFNMDLTDDGGTVNDRAHNDREKNWPIRWSAGPRTNQCYNVRHIAKHDVSTYGYDYLADGFVASENSNKRFVEETETGGTGTGLYRVFWAEDIKYDYTDEDRRQEVSESMEPGPQIGLPDHFDYLVNGNGYVFENTTNEWGLTQDKTTRILVRIPFFAGKMVTESGTVDVKNETFFTIPSDNRDRIYHDINKTQVTSPNAIQKKVMTLVATTPEYVKWKNDNNVTASDKDIFNEYKNITMQYPTRLASAKVTNAAGTGLSIGHCTASFATVQDPIAGLTETAITAFTTDEIGKKLQQTMDGIGVACYVDGMAFYKVLVRHFADTEVNPNKTTNSTYDGVYPHNDHVDLAKNYLGRYGIVRNTWYTITLDAIKHIGSSEFPEEGPIPDDEVDPYINARINVTQWAERTQHATLQ